MSVKSAFFQFRTGKVAYKITGEGKPLVILHGWGSSCQVLEPAAQQLSHIRKSYLMDLPGFGMSPEPPEAWSVDDYADLVEAFINSIEGDKVDMLVHSFGGRITLKLLARQGIKNRIDKVLITGGAGMKPKRKLSFFLKKYFAKSLKLPFLILPGSLRTRALNWLRQTSLWKRLGSSDYSKLSGVMRGTFVKSVTEHLDSMLPQIDHEVLLLWGEKDDATPLYQARRMESGLKNSALVVIDGAGHYAFLDKPKQFAAIAEAYFRGANDRHNKSNTNGQNEISP
jgi:pimeloyl-ACP methyl ester carboxylesterase